MAEMPVGDLLHRGDQPPILRGALLDLLIEPAHRGENQQQVGLNQDRDLRRELVVVAELDLVDGHRIVLVDYGEDCRREQRLQRVSGVEIAFPVVHVVPRQKDLCRVPAQPREEPFVDGHEEVLADGGTGLQLGDGLGRTGQPHDRSPGRHRARRDQHQLAPFLQEAGHTVHEPADPLRVQALPGVHQDAGTHLDHDAARRASERRT